MKKRLIVAVLLVALLAIPARAMNLFNKTANEMDTNFLRPLSDIKNTLENTVKLFKGTQSPVDRLRISGGFINQMAAAVDKLTDFVEYLNNKFVHAIVAKNAHAKVKAVVEESHNVLALLQKMADEMRVYRLGNGATQPVIKIEELPKDFPIVSELDTE